MPRDFDTFLRDSAPDHPVRDDHKRQLKLVLMSRVKDRNPRLPLSVAGAFIIVVILALTSTQSELGSFDFNLVPISPTGSGLEEYRAGLGKLYIAVDPEDAADSGQQSALEGVIEREAARHEELQGVTGWTIEGTTFFMVNYTYEVDGKKMAMSRFSETPGVFPAKDQSAFILNRRSEILERIRTDLAQLVGTEDRMVDGVPIRFKKWAVRLASQPEVICWIGTPIE